ncbi:MAG: hypothetical protein AAFR89_12670, partial [Cyanobacteria bacterium J06633_1]
TKPRPAQEIIFSLRTIELQKQQKTIHGLKLLALNFYQSFYALSVWQSANMGLIHPNRINFFHKIEA